MGSEKTMSKPPQIDDERVVHGLWWVAEAPTTKVAGILRYGSAGGIRLELSADPLPGLTGNLEAQQRHWHDQPNVILGHSDDERDRFTVVDALASRVGPQLLFFANYILLGEHVADAQIATFSQLFYEVEQLEAWAGGPRLADAMAHDSPTGCRSKILFAFETEAGRYEIHSDATSFFRERESGTAYTCTVLATMFNPLMLRGVIGELEKFLSLMTIFIGARVQPRRLCVRQLPESDEVDLIVPWGRNSVSSLSHHDMLVPLYNLGGGASSIFSKWFAEWPLLHQSTAMLLSACSTTYTAVKFLCLVSGLESFHRATQDGKYLSDVEFEHWRERLTSSLPGDMPAQLREKLERTYQYANECSLRTRLSDLLGNMLKRSKLQNSQRDRKSFVSFVIETRNRLTHGTGYPKADSDIIRASIDLTDVLLCLLLMRIGCSEELISCAARRLPWSSLVAATTD
jgi:hypothetical protein